MQIIWAMLIYVLTALFKSLIQVVADNTHNQSFVCEILILIWGQ